MIKGLLKKDDVTEEKIVGLQQKFKDLEKIQKIAQQNNLHRFFSY